MRTARIVIEVLQWLCVAALIGLLVWLLSGCVVNRQQITVKESEKVTIGTQVGGKGALGPSPTEPTE